MDDRFLLSDDKGKNIIQIFTSFAIGNMTVRIGMFGEPMFGSALSGGAATLISFTQEGRIINNTDVSKNIIRST